MKNQERVWKAEQAAAEEKKRIQELQRERAEERDRAELNELAKRSAGASGSNRLHWMYDDVRFQYCVLNCLMLCSCRPFKLCTFLYFK